MSSLKYKREIYVTPEDEIASKFVQEQQNDIIRKVTGYLKSNFTKEDQQLLEKDYWNCVCVQNVLSNVGLDYLRHIYFLTTLMFEDVPLHINEKDRFSKQLVSWRLMVGK